jgi:ribosomal protein S18 acetylase RimI-like enzyme
VPLFRSTFRVRCGSADALRSLVDDLGPGRGPWWVGPSASPPDAGAVLEAAGLRLVDEVLMMSAPLDTLPPAPASAPASAGGLSLRAVRDAEDLHGWLAAHGGAHGHPSVVDGAWFEVLSALGLGGDAPLRHYLASVDGTPVASASVFLGAGVAGLYNVATPPTVRGRGHATAVTLYALADARAAGFATAVLGAEAPAVNLYRRLGFRPRGDMRVYAPVI